MKTRLAGWLLVVMSAPVSSAMAAEAIAGDLGRLQGCWTTTAGPGRDIAVTLGVRGRAITVDLATPQGLKISVEGEIKVDEAASPKAIDWVKLTLPDGTGLPDTLGIYEIDGDALKLCTGGPSNGRPSAFVPGAGALADVVVFTRRKAETRAEPGK
jgi:uncharacterized protein (TIGR03067 family)